MQALHPILPLAILAALSKCCRCAAAANADAPGAGAGGQHARAERQPLRHPLGEGALAGAAGSHAGPDARRTAGVCFTQNSGIQNMLICSFCLDIFL